MKSSLIDTLTIFYWRKNLCCRLWLEGNLRVWSEFRLSAICCQTFSLSVVLDLALKRYGSVMRTSRTKARFWSWFLILILTAPSLNWKWELPVLRRDFDLDFWSWFWPLHRWTESEQNKIIEVNKWTMASCSRSQFSPTCIFKFIRLLVS